MPQEKKETDISEKRVSRRSMLKWSGALAAAAVVGAVAEYGASELMKPAPTPPAPPVSFKPPLSPEIQERVDAITKQLVDRHAGETIVYTTDKVSSSCMSDHCIMKAHVKDGILKAIETDDTVNPGSAREEVDVDTLKKGMIQQRTCPLARSWRLKVYSPTRILHPMKNLGKRGEDKFVRISWTEALDTIATKARETKEKYGPYAIYAGSSPWAVSSLLGSGVQAWGAHSHSGFDVTEFLIAGVQTHGLDKQSQSEVFKSKLVVMWGRNPTFIEEGTWPYFLVRAKETGIPFISIDPRYTASAEAYNAQWIPIRPGTDLAMMLAIADVLIKENLYDKEYVDKWVEPTGFAMFKDYLAGVSDGVEKSPEWAEKLCGVPAETIREFARLYAKSKPTMLLFGWAACRSMSTNLSRAVVFLQALTGNLTEAGGGPPFWGGYSKNENAGPSPTASFTRKSPMKIPVLFNGPCKWADAAILREKVDSGDLTRQEYNQIIGNKRDNEAIPNIKMLAVGTSAPSIIYALDANKHIRAFNKMYFTFGFAYDTKNTEYRYMDIVLPAVEKPIEDHNGIQASRGLANHFMYCKPSINPLGEARPDEWAWVQIAKRLGFAKDYNAQLADVLGLDEWDPAKWYAAYEQIWKDGYEKWTKRDDVAFRNPPSWEQFLEKPVYRYEALQKGPMSEWIPKGKNPFDLTPSGKIEVYCKALEDPEALSNMVLDVVPKNSYPSGAGYHMNECCVGKPGPAVTPLVKWHDDIYGTFHDSGVKQYPLLVLSPNSIYRSHSNGFGNPWLNGDCHRHACWISVADAKARGVKDGDLVRIYSSVGEMIIPVYVTSRTIPGVVSVFHGGYYATSGVKTDLMPDGIDRGGAQNFLIEENQPGKMIIGVTLDAGLCQVEKL
jgi:anaerobic dimethyl sulfoxide reductase subunit A